MANSGAPPNFEKLGRTQNRSLNQFESRYANLNHSDVRTSDDRRENNGAISPRNVSPTRTFSAPYLSRIAENSRPTNFLAFPANGARSPAERRYINLISTDPAGGSSQGASRFYTRTLSRLRAKASRAVCICAPLLSRPCIIWQAEHRDDERARHFIKKQADDSTAVDPHCLRAPAI